MAAPTNYEFLDRLYATIGARKDADPDVSYTAKLFADGRERIAKKLGEEAIETVLAAMADDKKRLISESADLVYHLFVLWNHAEVAVEDVIAELKRRESMSGIQEKNARGR